MIYDLHGTESRVNFHVMRELPWSPPGNDIHLIKIIIPGYYVSPPHSSALSKTHKV